MVYPLDAKAQPAVEDYFPPSAELDILREIIQQNDMELPRNPSESTPFIRKGKA
jgi:hypothetical protein